ncbi:MAG: Rrf2 family transcriptional regulator [Clostridiaceae bacterium]|nr:Rrf2 family transcriptional regulator [Clostridiaceae bacterium]
MKVSTKGRYGLRLVLELAQNEGKGVIPLREIAKKQAISEKYLEQIIMTLSKNGIVKSVRGANGGYMLSKKAEEITCGEVLRVLEGPLVPVDCVGDNGYCDRADECLSRGLWVKLRKAIDEVVDNTTLKDLLDHAPNK